MAKTECLINGIRIEYDACSSGSLKGAKEYYLPNFVYIGSNNGIIYVNNTLNDFKEPHHFFIYATKKQKLQNIRKMKLEKIEKYESV